MTGREDWLELTQESALDPEQRICDPHHHFWNHPNSRYLAEEFLQDIGGGHRIVKTVSVECLQFYDASAATQLQAVGETVTVDRIAREAAQEGGSDIAAGIVGFADLMLGDAVRPVLEAHLGASPRFRGIRHATAWHSDKKIHNAHTNPVENQLGLEIFRAGLKQVAEMELSFDAWLYQTQLPELTDLADAIPGLNIVLNHMAGPLGIGPYRERREQEFQAWKEQMTDLSRCENVSVKLGGRAMAMSGFGWSKRSEPPDSEELAAAMAPYFETCIELFGPQKCMFESNFPVDKAGCSYTVLWNAYKRVANIYSQAERDQLFHDSAVRFYRLDNLSIG
jgi:predicted TIM-barrel fold metal-dependent hydrolase